MEVIAISIIIQDDGHITTDGNVDNDNNSNRDVQRTNLSYM